MSIYRKVPQKVLLASAIVIAALVVLLASLGFGVRSTAASPQAASSPQAQNPDSQASGSAKTYEGVVSDTRCGAKHSAAINQSAGDCTRMCAHAGEHFALVDGDQVYVLDGEAARLKLLAGERVTVSGTLNGNTISVASVRPLS